MVGMAMLMFEVFFEPINYEAPENWDVMFLINFSDTGNSQKFVAREVIWTNSIVFKDLREYEVISYSLDKIIARNEIYTFELTKDKVVVEDKYGQKLELKNKFK